MKEKLLSRRELLRIGWNFSRLAILTSITGGLQMGDSGSEIDWNRELIASRWKRRILNPIRYRYDNDSAKALYRKTIEDAMMFLGASSQRIESVSPNIHYYRAYSATSAIPCRTEADGCQLDDSVYVNLGEKDPLEQLGILAHEATHAVPEAKRDKFVEDYGFMGKLSVTDPRGFTAKTLVFNGQQVDPFRYSIIKSSRFYKVLFESYGGDTDLIKRLYGVGLPEPKSYQFNILAELAADYGRINYIEELAQYELPYDAKGLISTSGYFYQCNKPFMSMVNVPETGFAARCGFDFGDRLLEYHNNSDRYGFFRDFGKRVLNWNPFGIKHFPEQDQKWFNNPANVAGIGLLAFLIIWRSPIQPKCNELVDQLYQGGATPQVLQNIATTYLTQYHPGVK